jgi:GNAT superfamily N-acetyltransferase
MEALHRRHGATCFTVNDDCLTPTYLEAFARILSERDPGFQISLWCKPVGTFTGERLRLLSRAGVRLIRWGVETGHPRVLKLMNKGTRLKDTCRVLRDAAGAGIWNHATMILGFPTETEAEARETVRFLDQNQDIIHSSIFFRFVLLSHSYILNNPETFSIREVTKAENPFSYEYRFKMSRGMGAETLTRFFQWAQAYRLEEMYRHPFWFYLRIREYLLLYAARYDPKELRRWKVRPQDLSLYGLGRDIRYFFEKPDQVPADLLEEISALIKGGGEVGTSWIKDNLKGAFLIGYAMEGDRVIATMTHKVPLPRYVAQIEQKTHLDLDGYLERGYTHVRPEYRGLGVGDALLKGLVKRSPGKRIYVTINVDNLEPIQLTLRNHMRLAATYYNERTGHEVGVFVNRSTGESQTVREGVGERRAHGVKRA